MSYIFRDGIAQTRMYLDEVVQKSWLETEVKREYNFAYQTYVTSVMTAYEDFYLDKTQISLVNGKQEYGVSDGLPNDTFKIRRVELNYDATANPTAFRKALPVNITQIKDKLDGSFYGSGSFPYYYVYGFEDSLVIGVLPKPSKDATNGMNLWYIQKISNLTVPTSPIIIPYPERYANGIALIAAGTLLRKGQQEEVPAARYIAEGKALRMEMQQELEDRISDEAKVISDSIGLDLDFSDPF